MVLNAVCNLLKIRRFAKGRVLRCKRWPFGLHFMTFYSVKGGLSHRCWLRAFGTGVACLPVAGVWQCLGQAVQGSGNGGAKYRNNGCLYRKTFTFVTVENVYLCNVKQFARGFSQIATFRTKYN